MRFLVRPLGLMPAFALAAGLLWFGAVSTAGAATPTVTMYDNDAPGPGTGFDPAQGWWGFSPMHIELTQGETILFKNPTGNKPHTVTSIQLGGSPFENQLIAGGKFDSSPSREALVMGGSEWRLDTSTLDPGNYAYYCRIHPWMVANLTVVAP